jgi:hypothetical protein
MPARRIRGALNAIRTHVSAGLLAEWATWRSIVRDPERTYWR